LIAAKLKSVSGLPWIADFRDSWIGWVSAPQWRPAWARRREWKMEQNVLQQADRLIAVSQGVCKDLLSRHESIDPAKWTLLPNGYDKADLAVAPAQRDNRFTLTYAGSLYGKRNPEMLVRALEAIQQLRPDLLEKLCLRFVGRLDAAIENRLRTSAIHSSVAIIPYVAHAESLSYLLASDAALLIIDDAPTNAGILTGKLFEYIGTRLPIIALTPQGEAASLIQNEGFGICFAPQDHERLQEYMLKVLSQWPTAVLQGNKATTDKFERRHLTSQLAGLLDSLLSPVSGK